MMRLECNGNLLVGYGHSIHTPKFRSQTIQEMDEYLIVRPENGGISSLLSLLLGFAFDDDAAHRWVIFVSILVRKLIGLVGKPMEWSGYFVDFFLNLLSLNDGLPSLLFRLLTGKVVMPHRDTQSFISTIGHLDGRIDLYYDYEKELLFGNPNPIPNPLMDLSIMASKLAYENPYVVRYIVQHHWKMHFVDFYNCWNDIEKESSTQVFILCDKPKDARLIVISFRGTEPFDADDWITDFDYSWYNIPKLGKVHMGFLEALGLGNRANPSTFHNQLVEKEANHGSDSAYYLVKTKLKELLEEHKNAQFIVTGHSLGGALAILFPTVLLLHEEMDIMERLVRVYTFGQPRVGDRQLGRFMEAHMNQRYVRVVYCNDLVPRLPYDNKTFLYKHFGICLYYNSFYVEQKVDEEPNRNYFGIRYLIPEYLNAVWELIRSLTMGYTHGPEYKEGWCSIFLRVVGLAIPGISAHSPTDYVNSVRLGKDIRVSFF